MKILSVTPTTPKASEKTLRDYFAAHADPVWVESYCQALLTASYSDPQRARVAAAWAYADAMIKARGDQK